MSVRLAGSLISGALLGKLLGFAREIEMAKLLGANIIADSFRGSLTAVLLPVAPLQSDILPSVLIPLHRGWREQGDAAQRSAALAIGLTAVSCLVGAVIYFLASAWVGVLVGGFDAAEQAVTIEFVRVMSLSIPASVLSAVLSAIEIAGGRSRIAAIRASVQNIGLMIGIGILAAIGQPLAVPWSFVIAFNLVAVYGAATLWREGALSLGGARPLLLAEVCVTFFRRFRPLLAVPLADQGNILLERLLASAVGIGAIASLDYARTLTESTFYLVSQPIGIVMLTRAAKASTMRQEVVGISQRLLALGLPISIFIAVFAPDIVQIVFARGAFGAHAVALTSGALRGISVGLWASMVGWVLVRLISASGRHGIAAIVIVSAYAANALVNVVAVPLLGTLGLGLGEATRGLMLLGGAALALACGGLMLRCVARAAIWGVVLAGAGGAICAVLHTPLGRLAAGAAVFGPATALWLAMTMPAEARRVLDRLRRPWRNVAPPIPPRLIGEMPD